ncbi:GTPase-activating protein [Blastocladiella emersonii ATCC 22665]|nr:GTPase-activating protein [Blastocladiella emersonii ATCC 22665]
MQNYSSSSPHLADDGSGGAHAPGSPRAGEPKSFWKRQVARLPGSIRPAGSATDPPKVFGAQHAFASPASIATKFSSMTMSSSSAGADGSGGGGASSPKTERRMKTRDELVDQTSDAWGELDDPKPPAVITSAPPSSRKSTLDTGSAGNIVTSPSTSAPPSHRRAPSDMSLAGPPSPARMADDDRAAADEARLMTAKLQRHAKFEALLTAPTVDLAALKKLCWSGIPEDLRPTCWQLLLGYLPCSAERRESALKRKRSDYEETAAQSFGKDGATPSDKQLMHQIHIDVLRTRPTELYAHDRVQRALERILYCWAMRHPASGYVQGINDLLTPFFTVFLAPFLERHDGQMDAVPQDELTCVEADSFWCLTKLIDGIQDNYTFAQPGIQRLVSRLKDLVGRIDAPLSAHLANENVEFIQFAFRWMNCLLMREVTHAATIRMWDAYLSEDGDLNDFHVYVCAAFLVKWSKELRAKDFPEIMLFLQSPPTKEWTDKDIELLLSEAFMWKSLFHNSPNHLAAK